MRYNPTDPQTMASADQLAAATRDDVPKLINAARNVLAAANGDRATALGAITVHFLTKMHPGGVAGVAADALLRLAEAGEETSRG
jgi:hypothetical protein